MEEPQEQENNRNPDGTFKPGVSGNPGGRPVGSVSIVGMIRKKFEEQPEYAEEWVDKLLEDPSNRKAVMATHIIRHREINGGKACPGIVNVERIIRQARAA